MPRCDPFLPDHFYHVYNRGNDKTRIFLERSNYRYFLSKVARNLQNQVEIHAFCLMPNHFHLLIRILESSFPIPCDGLESRMRSQSTPSTERAATSLKAGFAPKESIRTNISSI
ncbi:MAG: transposase [Ignavibacteriales bacterium]|nr:transposase [Ignavibacteriales bacterium]